MAKFLQLSFSIEKNPEVKSPKNKSFSGKKIISRFYLPLPFFSLHQGIRIKGREMALVWHEKASRTALQTSSLLRYRHKT